MANDNMTIHDYWELLSEHGELALRVKEEAAPKLKKMMSEAKRLANKKMDGDGDYRRILSVTSAPKAGKVTVSFRLVAPSGLGVVGVSQRKLQDMGVDLAEEWVSDGLNKPDEQEE